MKGCKVAGARNSVVARAEKQDYSRRAAIGLVAGAAALISAQPALAKYGEAPKVFGKGRGGPAEFVPYEGQGFSLLIPSQWEPSEEREDKQQVIRYDDHFDVVTNLVVIKEPSSQGSIDGFGSPEKFISERSYLLGRQVFDLPTDSEGGFKSGRVAATHVLDSDVVTDKKGNKYFYLELLTTTADGDEGGRHQLIKAGVKGGNLYIFKAQAGDKRWIKGQRKNCQEATKSFQLA